MPADVPLNVALLDMAGTTIFDDVDGTPFVLAVFEKVLSAAGVPTTMEELNPMRGLDKRQVFASILAKHGRADEADGFLSRFEQVCFELMPAVRPMPGAIETCRALKDRGMYVALGSGLPHSVATSMAIATGLHQEGIVDYVTSGERAGGGRPAPFMIRDVLARAGEDPDAYDYRRLLKVGDTPADVQEGRGVGAFTVAVTSGTHAAERLRRERPDAVLRSVAEITDLLERHANE